MQKAKFKKLCAEFERNIPYADADKYNKICRDIEKAAAPEHAPQYKSEFMSDWVDCACGWQSDGFWDLVEAAEEQWRKHVLKEIN